MTSKTQVPILPREAKPTPTIESTSREDSKAVATSGNEEPTNISSSGSVHPS